MLYRIVSYRINCKNIEGNKILLKGLLLLFYV